jgi:hypothetical protein
MAGDRVGVALPAINLGRCRIMRIGLDAGMAIRATQDRVYRRLEGRRIHVHALLLAAGVRGGERLVSMAGKAVWGLWEG